MERVKLQHKRHHRRRMRIRKRIIGTPRRPRLSVFRSLGHIYAQVVDDLAGRTLVAASTLEREHKVAPSGNVQAAAAVGRRLAEVAGQAGIRQVVFDRGGRRYHGRVKALAEAAREGGLVF